MSDDLNSSTFGDELDETAEQVDNLLEELNELVAKRSTNLTLTDQLGAGVGATQDAHNIMILDRKQSR